MFMQIKTLTNDWLNSAQASLFVWTTERFDWGQLVENALGFLKCPQSGTLSI